MADRVFTIERLNWRRTAAGWLVLPGTDRVAIFHDRASAEVDARERERTQRCVVNPFRCGGPFLHYQTAFDAARLCDWFTEIGLDPPGVTVESAAWAVAWGTAHVEKSRRQRVAAWEALDRVRFFRVAEGEVGLRLYLVTQRHYEYDRLDLPRTTERQYVGSTPYMLARTLNTANELCRALYVDGVVGEGGYVVPTVTDPTSTRTERQWNAEVENRFANLGLLELFATRSLSSGQTLFVVLRRTWVLEGWDGPTWRWSRTRTKTCGDALAAFDTLVAADAHVALLEIEARQTPSPFRFGSPHGWGPFDASAIWSVLSELAPIDFANLWTDYKADDSIWIGWWDQVLPSLTEDQIAIAWSLFESLRFYEVVEVEYRE